MFYFGNTLNSTLGTFHIELHTFRRTSISRFRPKNIRISDPKVQNFRPSFQFFKILWPSLLRSRILSGPRRSKFTRFRPIKAEISWCFFRVLIARIECRCELRSVTNLQAKKSKIGTIETRAIVLTNGEPMSIIFTAPYPQARGGSAPSVTAKLVLRNSNARFPSLLISLVLT